jgi:hypothetical protein
MINSNLKTNSINACVKEIQAEKEKNIKEQENRGKTSEDAYGIFGVKSYILYAP